MLSRRLVGRLAACNGPAITASIASLRVCYMMGDAHTSCASVRCVQLQYTSTQPRTSAHTSPPRHKRPLPPPEGSALTTQYKRHKRRKPTHFLALQLSQHPHALSAVATVQQAVTTAAQHLKPACIEPSTLHVTLQVWPPQQQFRCCPVLFTKQTRTSLAAGDGPGRP